MSTPVFIVAILNTRIWPAIFVLVLFRKNIQTLIAHATRFNFNRMEIEFGKAINSVSKHA